MKHRIIFRTVLFLLIIVCMIISLSGCSILSSEKIKMLFLLIISMNFL